MPMPASQCSRAPSVTAFNDRSTSFRNFLTAADRLRASPWIDLIPNGRDFKGTFLANNLGCLGGGLHQKSSTPSPSYRTQGAKVPFLPFLQPIPCAIHLALTTAISRETFQVRCISSISLMIALCFWTSSCKAREASSPATLSFS